MLLTPAKIKLKSSESRLNSSFCCCCFLFLLSLSLSLFNPGRKRLVFMCVCCFRSLIIYYPSHSQDANNVGGQLRADKECTFNGVTNRGSLEEGAGKRCRKRGADAHSEHRFPAPSSKLCQIYLAAEGALFISAQLSSDPVSVLRKVWLLIRLWKQSSAQART